MIQAPDAERALALYRTMARIRAFEDTAEEASKGGVAAFGASLSAAKVRGPLHPIGTDARPASTAAISAQRVATPLIRDPHSTMP